MKKGWQTEKLGDVCVFLNRGISPKYLEQGGICVLNQKCIREHHISYELARRHDSEAKAVGTERFIQLGDVLVNSTGTGTLGRVAQVREIPPEPTTVDSHVTIIRPKSGKFFRDFFGYILVFIEELIKEAGEGCGGQTELARSVLAERFIVSYPMSVAEQQRIVSFLDEAFAGIAKATANTEKNLKNAREFFDSYLNGIFTNKGDGWEEKRLGDVCKTTQGVQIPKSKQSASFKAGYRRYLYISDFDHDKNLKYVEDVYPNKIVSVHDLIVVNTGASAGKIYRGIDGVLSNNLFKVSFDGEQIDYDFAFYFITSVPFKRHQEKIVKGTANPHMGHENFKSTPFAYPSLEKQREIAAKARILKEEIKHLENTYEQKLAALDELKKSLLHQAFTGAL